MWNSLSSPHETIHRIMGLAVPYQQYQHPSKTHSWKSQFYCRHGILPYILQQSMSMEETESFSNRQSLVGPVFNQPTTLPT